LVTAITVTPVLSSYLLPHLKQHEEHDGPMVRWLKRANARVLGWAFAKRAALLAVVGLAVVAAGAAVPMLPRAFLPPFNEGTLTISLLLDPGVSLAESDRIGRAAERLILGLPEAISVGRRTGRAELDEHAEGVHSSEIDVDLRDSGRSKAEVLADLRRRLAVLPVVINIGQPISHRLDHLLSGVRAQIALKLFGDDLDTLRTLAGQFQQRLAAIPGLVDLQIEKQIRIPQVQVVVDYERAAHYGVTPALVTESLQELANGREVSEVIDGNRRFDVVLRLPERDRTTGGLANLLVETPSGRLPLSLFATVEETDGPNQILRENGRRRIVLMANGDGSSDLAAVVAAVRAELAATPLPSGYFTRLEGSFQAQEEAAQRIALLSLVSLAMIFVVLFSRYHSAVLTLIIMGNVPLALIGSVAALWIAGQPLSVASMIGFITLAGISARNGILKISHYINLVLHEGEQFGPAMIVRGSQERLAPVLMTALSAGLALVPLLIGAEAPGKEILHPVAVTIFGGLISATLLDTLLTPVLFLMLGRRPLERLVAQQRVGAQEGDRVQPAEAY